MKRRTTLFLLLVLAASAAHAGPIEVNTGGFILFETVAYSDDLDSGQRAQGFRNDTEINIEAEGKLVSGLTYGGVIQLDADVTADADAEGFNASRTYIYIEGGWGRIELGSTDAPDETMRVDSTRVARGTGGIDGNYSYYLNTADSFIVTPQLPVPFGAVPLGDESTRNANKVNYYSPKFSGFQLGLSYAPDQFDRGQVVTRTDSAGGAGDIFSGGLSYEGAWDEIKLAASLIGEWGDSEIAALEDLSAWAAGASVEFYGVGLAASYGEWGASLMPSGLDDSDFWTVGASYGTGPWGVSLNYMESTLQAVAGDNNYQTLVFDADYALAEGLTPFAELAFFEMDGPGTAVDNDGQTLLLGVELAF